MEDQNKADLTNLPGGRVTTLWRDGWEFVPGEPSGQDLSALSSAWRAVCLPHDWSVDYPPDPQADSGGSGGYARTGTGWYRRRFRLRPQSGRCRRLYFEGIYMNCQLWLNGQELGSHTYGYTSFWITLPDSRLTEADNELLIFVDNSQQPGSRWYSGSGITRPVWLIETDTAHFAPWGIWVRTPAICDRMAELQIQVDIEDETPPGQRQAYMTDLLIQDQQGLEVARSSKAVQSLRLGALEFSLRLKNISLWDPDNPVLYTAILSLRRNEHLADQVALRFGIRDACYDKNQGLLLNRRKLIIKGVCLHHDGGCVGAAVLPGVWRYRLRRLKEMGANALRCSHNPPDPALLDLADEMGFMVLDEAFDEWAALKGKDLGSNAHNSRGYSEYFSSDWHDDLSALIRRDRNHPSVLFWSIGNEIHEQILAEGSNLARRLTGLCHSLDPDRLVTAACDLVGAQPVPASDQFLNELDIVGINYTDRWRVRTETFFDEEKQRHPDWLLMGSEDISVSGRRGDYRLDLPATVWGPVVYYANMLKAEKLWKYLLTRPFVMGSFMWTGVDYLGECFWPDKNASAGVLDTCGFPKDGYWFYQSVWRQDRPVLHAFPHRNLNLPYGRIYPLVVYTNCFSVELLISGQSYGVKAYEFPAQGMSREWAHFERPMPPISTNDLHLTWDVPYSRESITLIGRDERGREQLRQTLCFAGSPARLSITILEAAAGPGEVCLLGFALKDETGQLVPDDDRYIQLELENATLLGMDNGDPACHDWYRSGRRPTYKGLAMAVILMDPRYPQFKLKATTAGLPPVEMKLTSASVKTDSSRPLYNGCLPL